MEDLNRSPDGREQWRNKGTDGEAAFQDATKSEVQAAEKNWNQENKRGKVEKKQRQNAQNTQHKIKITPRIQAQPPMQQPLCVVSLLDSKGALEREEEAAGHRDWRSLKPSFASVP